MMARAQSHPMVVDDGSQVVGMDVTQDKTDHAGLVTGSSNDPQAIVDSIFAQVTKKTKVIAVPHILSVYGVILPVKEICQKAKAMGIFTIIDGAQAVGQIHVDVKDMGCDAYYSSLHKWLLSPGGNGILYVDKARIAQKKIAKLEGRPRVNAQNAAITAHGKVVDAFGTYLQQSQAHPP